MIQRQGIDEDEMARLEREEEELLMEL